MGRSIGEAPEEVVNQYAEEADKLGVSRQEYVRQCIEVGRTLFKSSGKFDIEQLRELTEDVKTTPEESDLTTTDGNLTEAIIANLSTEEQRALTKEEIRTTVFGTEEEQIEEITKTLKQLHDQGRIQPLVDEGYIKTNE
jgi:hypothetical protein